MNSIDGLEFNSGKVLRVVVIGNSNSVLVESYSWKLRATPGFIVKNESIGATPNVVLLDFIARETEWNYDFIIFETAVVDSLQCDLYPSGCSAETLELFIRYVRSVSSADLIMITIPTRDALLAPGKHYQEELYRKVAIRFGIPILDGFDLVRELVGRPKMTYIEIFGRQAERLVSAFHLPAHFRESLTWRALRDKSFVSNSLGIYGYFDGAHFGAAMHDLMADLLITFMQLPRSPVRQEARDDVLPAVVMAVKALGGQIFRRESSLIARDVVRFSAGQEIRYHCPPGYRAFGLLVNEAQTACFLQLDSPNGSVTFDMRFLPVPTKWMAVMAQIIDPIGDGEIVVTIPFDTPTPEICRRRPRTGIDFQIGEAEIAELIVVRDDWRDVLPSDLPKAPFLLSITDKPWAIALITDAAKRAATVIAGCERAGLMVDNACAQFIETTLDTPSKTISLADRARIMLLMGMSKRLLQFLKDLPDILPEGSELAEMRTVMQGIDESQHLQPDELLDRVRTLIRSGETNQAEMLCIEGMARFTGNIAFFFEYGWIASKAKNWAEAVHRWRLTRESFPHHPSSWVHLALSLRGAGQENEAECLLTEGLNRFPDEVEIATVLARLMLDINNRDEALKHLTHIRHRWPDHGPSRNMLIEVLIQQGASTTAKQEIEELINDGLGGRHVMRLARRVVDLENDPVWLRSIWRRLLESISDRKQALEEARTLFRPHELDFEEAFKWDEWSHVEP